MLAILVSQALRTPTRAVAAALAAVALAALPSPAAAAALPALTSKGPVGWETLRRLDALPLGAPGVITRQASSYDPAGFNDDGFSGSHSCRRQTAAEGCVIAEHSGPGEIASIWFTRDRGVVARTGRVRIEIDGRRVVDAPLQAVVDGRLGAPFSFPLVANRNGSSGGVYIKVPMPFRSSMKVSTQFNPRFHHVTYRTFPDAGGVPSFDRSDRALDVLARLRAAGRRDPKPFTPGATTVRRALALAPGQRVVLASLARPGAITALQLRLGALAGPPRAQLLRGARLQISFDGRRTVDSPLGEFFGSGVAPATVRALMFAQGPSGALSSWWPMPFRRTATVSLVNASRTRLSGGQALVSHAPEPDLVAALAQGRAGLFHASSRRGATVAGRDWTVLAAGGRGKLVGVTHSMRGPASRRYLEGDERVYVDGRLTMHGTGTEDFYEGGWYFIRGTFTRPLNGNPSHVIGGPLCPGADCTGTYRLLLADSIAFGSSLRFGFEHGNRNLLRGLYGATAYWYG